MTTRSAKTTIAVIIWILLIALEVHADQIFQGGFSDREGNAGTFTLLALQDNANQWTAINGTLTVTSGNDAGIYDLYSIGDNPTAIGHYSPSSNFYFNNVIYYPGWPLLLDNSGLLFVNSGSGATGVAEVTLWGPFTPPGLNRYSFWSSSLAIADYLTKSDTATVFVVPEPSTFAIWSILFGAPALLGFARRSSHSAQSTLQ